MTYEQKLDALDRCLSEPVREVRRALLDKIQSDPDFFTELDDDQKFQIGTIYSDCCSNVALPTRTPFVPKQLQPV
jgi:hypothetical protein